MTRSPIPGSTRGLAPDNALLVLIDHQVGLLRAIRDLPPQEVRDNVLGLAKSAKTLDVPVVLTTNLEGGSNGRLLPKLRRIFAGRHVIGRPGVINAWHWPAFRRAVEQTGRRKIVIAGIGLQSAALGMAREGYEVHAVIDASGAESLSAHDLMVATLRDAGLRIHTWYSVAAELLGDWRRELEAIPLPEAGAALEPPLDRHPAPAKRRAASRLRLSAAART